MGLRIRKVLGRYAECVDTQTLDNIRTADFYTPDGVLLEPGLQGDRAEGVGSIIASHVNEGATSGGKVRPTSRTAAFMSLVKGRPVYPALSGKTMQFNGDGKCVAGC